MTKPVKLVSPEAIEAAKQYKALYERFEAEKAKRIANFHKELEEMSDEYNKTFFEFYKVMGKDIIKDPAHAWYNSTHDVDLRYAEFGDVYLFEKKPKLLPEEPAPSELGGTDPLKRLIIH